MVTRADISTRRFEQLFTATEANVTRDELPVAPGPGLVKVWVASDVSDSLLTARIGGNIQVNRQLMPNKGTNAPIEELNQMAAASKRTRGGEAIIVDVVEVTAANMRVIVVWAGIDRGLG